MSFFSKNDRFVVSLTVVNDNPSLMILNDDLSLTIVFFKKQSHKKQSQIVLIKTIVFKNDRYLFFKSSKRVGRF